MLNPNDTIRFQRIPMLTRPGRPLESGWGRELALWFWHLFFLPEDQAQPWPRWLQRHGGPMLPPFAERLGLVATTGRDRRPRLRRPAQLKSLLQHLIAPYAEPVFYWAAARIETYSDLLSNAYARASPATRAGVVLCGCAALAAAATTPLDATAQCSLALALWVLTLFVRQLVGYGPGVVLVLFSILASTRYIWWRLTQTLDLEPGAASLLGAILLASECYTWFVMVLGYLQNARPLRRKSVSLPLDRAGWPTIDVFIPTYNESLQVVKPTVLAALSLDWPADKLRVYLLDDGRRPAFREFAASCGAAYIVRPDNAHAKAGNLNHALKVTDGDYVAIFDCDHIPARNFLTATVGWFLRDPRCAMLQTPHHFFSPDPFERNLGTFRRVPNEGNLFYGLIQDGNDLWNATFFCGSCAVLRRGPLLEVGGIATETVTEDAHTALKLHRRGYATAYLRQVLAGGLATDSLSGHIGQRIRWARGMAQIFRLDNPLTGRGLTLMQRLCYANAMLHFFSGIPRLVFLTAPLAYLFFQFHIINAAAATIALYALPHLAQASLANSHMQGRFRHSFWNEAYEAVLSWYIALPTTLALINPRLGKFNVTAKGGLVANEFFDWRISAPYLALVLLNLAGVAISIPRLLYWNTFEAGTVTVNLLWTIFNLILLGAVLGVAAETRQVRTAHRVPKRMPAALHLPVVGAIACKTTDFSMHGLGLVIEAPLPVRRGDRLRVSLWADDAEHAFDCVVMTANGNHLGVEFRDMSIEQEKVYVSCTFGSPDAWSDWDRGIAPDRPLRSFAEVFSFGATGYVRLLQSLYIKLISWRPGRAPSTAG
jgi:cellulose synthase (UDP-forming)